MKSAAFFFIVCANVAFITLKIREAAKFQNENVALREALVNSKQINPFPDLHAMLDSVDQQGNETVLPKELTQSSLIDRIKLICERMTMAESTAKKLQTQLYASREQVEAYLLLADAFRGEVDIRDSEVKVLEAEAFKTKRDYEVVASDLSSTKVVVNDLYHQQHVRDRELVAMTERLNTYKNAEAERYYKEAQELELDAKRIVFSGAKKRDVLKEAVELYKKAYSLGKIEALANIESLEKRTESKQSVSMLIP